MKNKINRIITAIILFLLLGMSQSVLAQNTEIPVWKSIPGAIQNPEYKEEILYDSEQIIKGVNKVVQPTLTPFLVDSNKSNGVAVIVCPGGGYAHLAINKEGFKVAKWLNSIGISAFVLKYRLPNDAIMKNKTIAPLQDAQEAIRTIRRNATEWHLDPTKIGIMGFSAGGHLAATLSTHYQDNVYDADTTISARPDFAILIYPVISMEDGITHNGSKTNFLGANAKTDVIEKYSNEKQITSETPKTFLVHASDDKAVPVANSINYYLNLRKNAIPAEMHLYENGGHGFGLGTGGTHKDWPKACEKWLTENNYIAQPEGYLFSYFKGNGQDGLHLAYSQDGYKWKTLKNDTSFLTPEAGKDKLMRDPNIILGADGLYHMVWTVSWTDKGIGYASSKDLIHWSKQEFIPVMSRFKSARNTWAPEITYDSKQKKYIIYWASTLDGKFLETKPTAENGYNHRIYYTTTRDFKKFKRTKLLFNPGFNVIDATIVPQEQGYAMFMKDETPSPAQKNIKIAYSQNVTGSYHNISEPITGKYWAEGPTVTTINGQQIVYFDKYKDKKYGAVIKMASEWKDISDEISFPEGTRHGTIIKVPTALINQLKKE
jgi:acetyl esterase/lipase